RPHADAERRRDQPGHRQRRQERHAGAGGQRGRRVHPGAEEGAVAEAEVAGEAAQDRPARGEGDPGEDEGEERLVECRQPERGEERQGEAADGERRDGRPTPHAHTRSGRNSRTTIRSVKETSGAQVGAVSAIVTASLTPITTPATSGPRGF